MRKSFSSKKLAFLLAFFILLSDQISKYIIASYFQIGERVPVLPFFNITRVANKGISFGMLSDTVQPTVLIILSLAVIIALFMWTKNNKKYMLPSSMIIAGALGNIVDRIAYKSVIDFLDFHVDHFHWPAFNVADSAIVIGVCILFFISYGEEKS
ncbi:MAG: signal peptidase II [Alphaproteobacteria bacterium]|nr:signal peptidase II [Alphaproteobacteria bacterium]